MAHRQADFRLKANNIMGAQKPLFDNAALVDDPELNRLIRQAEAAGEITAAVEAALDARLTHVFDNAPEAMGAVLFENLKADTAAMLEDRAALRAGFQERQRQKWGAAFDKLRALIEAAIELGGEFSQQYGQEAAMHNDFLFDALRRLHARACLLANETHWMLEGGFASGAMSRWRTLHEVSVIAFFLRQHGQAAAERYLLHEGIESFQAARKYQEHYKRLGEVPFSAAEFQKLQDRRDDLCRRFGKDYDKDWGWAADALKAKSVTFTDIEKSLNMDHMRPYFKWACYGSHAGSKGLHYDLGNVLTPPDKPVLLAGPSDAGLADPGNLAAMSLFQVTVCLLTHHMTLTTLVVLNALNRMSEEVQAAFIDADAKLKGETDRLHAAEVGD